ncbi:MAG: DNA replication/repair protein RecF [Firmicutes bacterium]|nr:DNA replication/repair protein RecF [Bacillota bacterium]
MYISSIFLKNYRNYKKQDLQLSPGINIIQGANGQGKSNFLESVYNLCFGRPFRGFKEIDLVYRGTPYYYLQGTIYLQQRCYKVEVGYEIEKKRKIFKINGRKDRSNSLAGRCPVVFFVPEDLELIRRGPEERRRFLDREISQIAPLYGEYLSRYNRVIYQKNRALKEKKLSRESLKNLIKAWNAQIIHFGSRILQKRAYYISAWSELASRNFGLLFENEQQLKISYKSFLQKDLLTGDLSEIELLFSIEIAAKEEEEYIRGFSIVGPHRDDLAFLINGCDAKRFASHGQQRSAVIALKAAQIQYYHQQEEKPLFILDDIFSELDEKRREQCFELLAKAEQIFLSITKKEKYLDPIFKKFSCFSFFHVQNGSITEIKENGNDRLFY